MSYASQADMTERFGAEELAQRTDRVNGLVIDAVVLGRALADADSEINSYLGARYVLPLANTPPVINRLACDMARYRLFDAGMPETVRVRYQDAISLLKRMASGEVELAGLSTVAISGGGNAVAARTTAKQFNGASLAGY